MESMMLCSKHYENVSPYLAKQTTMGEERLHG